MEARHQVPGSRLFLSLANPIVRRGVLTGIYLSCLLLTWLLIANRVPELEPFALLRNLVAGGVAVLAMGAPVLRFRSQPGRMFLSGVAAWLILALTYRSSELYFKLLESRMGAFHLFMLGAVTYGFLAVLRWVYLLCAECRQRHIAQAHPPAVSLPPRRTG